MEFSVKRQEFAEALAIVSEVITTRSIRPILQNILITGNNDQTITITATDLEIGISINVDVESLQDPQKILLPGNKLLSVIRTDWSENIHLTSIDNKAQIKTKQGKFNLSGVDPDDYPILPNFQDENSIIINGENLKESIQKTIFATAKGDSRYALNGIYINVLENNIEFVASDTHRLSLVKKKIKNHNNSKFDGIILTKGMSILAKLANEQDIVEFNITSNELLAKTSKANLVIRKVEGQFPRYNDIIPEKIETGFTVIKEDFVKTIHLVGLMADPETKAIKLSFHPEKINIDATDYGIGEGNVDLEAEIIGKLPEIKFNYEYLLDVLKVINSDKITLQVKNNESAAMIELNDFKHIIMPINR